MTSTATTRHWLQQVRQALPGAARNGSAVGHERRDLADVRTPGSRTEAWRFTPTATLTALPPRDLHSSTAAPRWPAVNGSPHTLRLQLDGAGQWVAPDGTSPRWPAGVTPLAPDDADAQTGAIAAAVATGSGTPFGLLLNGLCPLQPLALEFSGSSPITLEVAVRSRQPAAWIAPRLLLLLAPGADLTLLWHLQAEASAALLPVLEARLQDGARLQEVLLAPGCPSANLLASSFVHQAPRTSYSRVSALWRWGLGRDEPWVCQGEGQAATELRGLAVAHGHTVLDTHSRVRFDGPEGRLEQQHNALVDGHGRSVFNGSVVVPRCAQQTDATQLSRNLLLSDTARIDTKPQLEIVADDVRCSHGATVSHLQEDELFYLQSRGLRRDQASRLLQRGFCEDVLQHLPAAALAWGPLQALLADSEHEP